MIESCGNLYLSVSLTYTHRALSRRRTHLQGLKHRGSSMLPCTMVLTVHTTTARSTEAGIGLCQRRWIMPAGRRRPVGTVHFRPLVVVEDVSAGKGSYSYSYSYSCSCRLACRTRQHMKARVSFQIHLTAVAAAAATTAAAIGKWKLVRVLVLVLFIFVAQADAAPSCA